MRAGQKSGRYVRLGASVLQMAAALLLLAACAARPLPFASPVGDETAPAQSETAVAGVGWQSGAPMPTARSEMRAAVVDGIFYVPGGFGGLTISKPTTRQMTHGRPSRRCRSRRTT